MDHQEISDGTPIDLSPDLSSEASTSKRDSSQNRETHQGPGIQRREFLRRAALLSAAATASLSSVRCFSPTSETGAADVAESLSEFSNYDGVGLAQLVKSGEVTAAELVEDTIRKVETVNPKLNAVLTSLFDVQKARDRANGPLGDGPLSGVPVMLKNLTGYNAAPIDSGSRLLSEFNKKFQPELVSSPLVAAMESSGMVVTGITNTPEMGLTDTTEPVLHGATKNPWNTAYSPGGSSGGTGSAVAAGIVPLAHGNDGGGSIRLPASHCGIFGLKPTRSRELGNGDMSPINFANDLCLSRSVRDTAAFLSLVEKPDNPNFPPVGYVEGPSGRKLKVAVMNQTFSGAPLHPEVAAATANAARLCEDLGHTLEEIELPMNGEEFIDVFIHFWAALTLESLVQVKEWFGDDAKPEDYLEPWTLGLTRIANERGAETCLQDALRVFPEAAQAMQSMFGQFDVMLSPVLAVPPFELGHHSPTGDFDTVMARVLEAVAFTPLQNAAGLPGMSVPLHWTAEGLPVGVQFSADRGQEAMLLELAYDLENAQPWADKHPPIWA